MLLKKLFLLITYFIFLNEVKSQTLLHDSLYVGKRGNVVWNRKIATTHMANEQFTSFYPIFYRTSSANKWQKAGWLGKNISSQLLASNEKIAKEFSLYKKNKKASYWMMGAAAGFITGWTVYTAVELNKTNSVRAYIKPISLLLLGGFEVSFYIGRRLNTNGDKYLNYAVYYYNKF